MRAVNLNSHYVVVFNNPRDSGQISILAQQVQNRKRKLIEEAFEDTTSKPHEYLLLDFCQSTPEEFRVRSKVFKGDDMNVYIPKGIKVSENSLI